MTSTADSTSTTGVSPSRHTGRACPPHPGRLRLTRRGRIVVVALFVVLCFVAFSLGRTSSQASTHPGRPATRAVTVEPGETLWQIAKAVEPGADPRDTVDRIRELNGLSSAPVQAGQRLIVPA